MSTWSITDKMYLYLSYDRETVYIANPESKKYWGPVQKISESVDPPRIVDNKGSKIKILDGKVYLEVSGKYLKINNINSEDLLNNISGATINNGEATGVIFGFTPDKPSETALIFKGTEFYKKTEEEFLRKINLTFYKKTTKYIPGHKYMNDEGYFWYIGTYYSHRGSSWERDYENNRKELSHVFVNYLPPTKKLSDILMDCDVVKTLSFDSLSIENFPKAVIFSAKAKSMVDLGEELEIDKTIEESYETRIFEFENTNRKEYTFGSSKYYYTEVGRLLSIFDLTQAPGTPTGISDITKDIVKSIFKSNIDYIIFKASFDITKSEEKSISYVRSKLEDTLNYSGESDNGKYIRTLVKSVFGIDLEKMIVEAVDNSKPVPDKLIDFNDYIDNIGRYEFLESNFRKTIDFVYVNKINQKLSKYLPSGPYRDMLSEIYKEALETGGANLECFAIENVGTVRTPVLKYTFKVGLKDLMKHCGVNTPYELPEDIKEDLTRMRIYESIFITRSDLTPEI